MKEAIITNNVSEFKYMISWCEENKMGIPFRGIPNKYPFMICIEKGQYATWLDRIDRAIEYIQFKDFINALPPAEGKEEVCECEEPSHSAFEPLCLECEKPIKETK